MRLDTWIWAVRMTKTRTQATTAVKLGKVEINGALVTKPAKEIKIGDRISLSDKQKVMVYEVVQFIKKQTSDERAASYFVDHSPEPVTMQTANTWSGSAHADIAKDLTQKKKYRKQQGRPTKRDRRSRDELWNHE